MKISNQFQLRAHTILNQLEMLYHLFQVITQSDLGENHLSIQNALRLNYLQDKSNDNYIILYNFLCLTPRNLKILLAKFFISEYSS